MALGKQSWAFHWPGTPGATLTLEPYELELRAAFGTSHSSTTRRRNALFTFRTPILGPTVVPLATAAGAEVLGYGEVGLPPKKAAVYHADLADGGWCPTLRQRCCTAACTALLARARAFLCARCCTRTHTHPAGHPPTRSLPLRRSPRC